RAPRGDDEGDRGHERQRDDDEAVAHGSVTRPIIREAAFSPSAASRAVGRAARGLATSALTRSSNGSRSRLTADGSGGAASAWALSTSSASPVKGAWPVMAR